MSNGKVLSADKFLIALANIVEANPDCLRSACEQSEFPTTDAFLATMREYLTDCKASTASCLPTVTRYVVPSAFLRGAAKVYEHHHWLACFGREPWEIPSPTFDWSSRRPTKAA